MKKLIVLAVILAVALMLAPAALAGGGTGNGNSNGPATHAHNVKYSLNGTVQAVDASANTLSVLVKQSNRRARAYKGDVVTLVVTATTKLCQRTVDGELVAIGLADFKAGDRVQSVGKLNKTDPADPIFTAFRITLRPAAGTCTNCGG